MAATKSTPDQLRGWVRPSRRYPADWQRSELTGVGAGVIYEHGHNGETVKELIRSLVAGDTVLVTTVARLGYSKSSVLDAVAAIHAKGAWVMETTTGRHSGRPKSWYAAVEAIQAELNGERRTLTSAEAREYGSRGGRASAARVEKISPKLRREMLAIWRDRNQYQTQPEACESVRKLLGERQASDRTIARWLGRRSKGGGGRPRKTKAV